MPHVYPILNLPDFTIKSVKKGYPLIVFEVCYKGKKQCAHCQSFEVRIKSSFIRQVRHHGIGDKPSLLKFQAHKLYYHDCKRYSNQRFPDIRAYQRASEPLQQQIFYQHTYGISQKRLAEQFRLGKALVFNSNPTRTQRKRIITLSESVRYR